MTDNDADRMLERNRHLAARLAERTAERDALQLAWDDCQTTHAADVAQLEGQLNRAQDALRALITACYFVADEQALAAFGRAYSDACRAVT